LLGPLGSSRVSWSVAGLPSSGGADSDPRPPLFFVTAQVRALPAEMQNRGAVLQGGLPLPPLPQRRHGTILVLFCSAHHRRVRDC
jgi:hypothetical protein